MRSFCLVFLLLVSSQAFSATFSLGLVDDSKPFSNFVVGTFEDRYKFTTPDIKGLTVSLTNVSVNGAGAIKAFTASLDGRDLTFKQVGLGVAQAIIGLGVGSILNEHELTVSGIVQDLGASYGGSIAVTTMPTPIPAAVWLFAPALAGLAGLRKRPTVNGLSA